MEIHAQNGPLSKQEAILWNGASSEKLSNKAKSQSNTWFSTSTILLTAQQTDETFLIDGRVSDKGAEQ